jgi:hypothetical protein
MDKEMREASMANRRRKDRGLVRSRVLTLRMTEEEMLRFRVSALSMGKKRARIVRERVADLIRPTAAPKTAARDETVAPEPGGTVATGTVIGEAAGAGMAPVAR